MKKKTIKRKASSKLPVPNAKLRTADQTGEFTAAEIRGMVSNPVYAGIGKFPQIVPDEEWVKAAAISIRKEGIEQFLVNMLHMLRETFRDDEPSE